VLNTLQALIDGAEIGGDTINSCLNAIVEHAEDDDDRRLAAFLLWLRDNGNDAVPDGIGAVGSYGESFSYGHSYYRVLTEDEAHQAVRDAIVDSLWAFRPEFLASETGLDISVFEALADKCEGANDAVLSLIKGTCGLDDFVNDAVSADGRGHFLAPYDGEEREFVGYYIYQEN